MKKRLRIRILSDAFYLLVLVGGYYGIAKYFMAHHFSQDSFLLTAVIWFCGAFYAFVGYKYITVISPKNFTRLIRTAITVICFLAGCLGTYFMAQIVGMGLHVLFVSVFQIDDTDPTRINFYILTIAAVSISIGLMVYTSLVEKNRITQHK